METDETMVCTARGRGRLIAPIILLCVGLPHLIIGLAMLVAGWSDTVLRICGAVFSCSGGSIVLVAGYIFLGWLRQKVVADERGLTYYPRLGSAIFAPWDQVSGTIYGSKDSFKLVLHLAGKDVTFPTGSMGHEDLQVLLQARRLLYDPSGRHKRRASSDEIIEVRHLT